MHPAHSSCMDNMSCVVGDFVKQLYIGLPYIGDGILITVLSQYSLPYCMQKSVIELSTSSRTFYKLKVSIKTVHVQDIYCWWH